MPSLDFKRRPLSTDHGGRVYFCRHPEDETASAKLIDDVLDVADCIACFDKDARGAEAADWLSVLTDMQLFVVAVSRRFLTEPSRARDVELRLAEEQHIPVLPILLERVPLEEYNRIFPDIQYLDPNDESDAALPYTQKLERALGEVLQSSSVRAKIRESFDLSFFLSYRKKDRRVAQSLLEKIHSREEFRSVAIWYDEFLLPGEDFNHSIEEAMNSSSLFLMSVTPHMLEPTNYVLNVEFPAAKEKRMQIVAVETAATDKDEFSDKFNDAPPLISIDDEDELFCALDDITDACSAQKDDTAERKYYLGLAYLNGISVEVNRPLGVKLIRESADEGHGEAIQKLITMYRCGDGVERNYKEVMRLHAYHVKHLYDAFRASNAADDLEAYLSALIDLADEYKSLGDYDSARKILDKTKSDADRLRNANHLKATGHNYMMVSTLRLASVETAAGNTDEAIMILKSNLPFFRFEYEESGSDFDRQGLAVLLNDLSILYARKGNAAKSEKYANEAIELNEELLLMKEKPSALNRYNLAINLFNKAIAHSERGDHEGAIEVCFRGMETVSAAMEHRESYALYIRFHLLLAEQYRDLGKVPDAKAAYAKALDLCESPATPQDIVTLKLKAEVLRSTAQISLDEGDALGARRNLRTADTLYEEIIAQFGDRKTYRDRASVAYLDGQLCSMMSLVKGAVYNYEKCIEYMEKYIEDVPEPESRDMHVIALVSFLLGTMNGASPIVPLLQRSFTIWSELADKEDGQQYAPHRDKVAAILVRHMF